MNISTVLLPAVLSYQAQEGSGSFAEMIAILVALALAPFLLSMITAFAKLVIVGGLLRQALGTQQTPPSSVITGIALVLTIHIMAPVAERGYTEYTKATESAPAGQEVQVGTALDVARRVVGEFLDKHSSPENRQLFVDLRARLGGTDAPPLPGTGPLADQVNAWAQLLTIQAPAFLLSELTEAFQIGFLLLVPFLVIELVVSNILLALGMMMMNPQVITLPLKLLLFVLVDGWRLILEGLVQGYVN